MRLVVWVAGLASAAAHALAVACVAGDAHAGDASQRAVGDAPGAAGYVVWQGHDSSFSARIASAQVAAAFRC